MLEQMIHAGIRATPRPVRRSRRLRELRSALAYRLMRYRVHHGLRLVPEIEFSTMLQQHVSELVRRQGSLDDYVEFGVYTGTSLACAHRVLADLGQTQSRLFGFDSFEGMPPDAETEDDGTWLPGSMKSDLEFAHEFLTEHGVDWGRTFLVKGWFSDTLTEETRERYGIERVSIAMVDCDLYSSALDALRFLRPVLADEALLLFDDWYSVDLTDGPQGEAKALEEFAREAPEFEFESAEAYSATSKVLWARRHG